MTEALRPQGGDSDGRAPASGRSGGLGDLALRAASAVVMVAGALGSLWAGGAWFTLFWAFAGLAVYWEWEHLAGGRNMLVRLALGAGALGGAAAFASLGDAEWAIVLVLAGAAGVGWLGRREFEDGAQSARQAGWCAAGLLYAGAMVIAVCVLRHSLFLGPVAVLWLFAVVWGTDVMAYFGGRLIGGPKLWPRVSPGKTWSGFCVGVGCGAAAGAAVVAFAVTPGEAPLAPVFLLGLATAAVSQGGDLFESMVKRRYGVKDSGRLIPGHGGAMDRLDGFIFAAAFAALVGALHKGAVAAAHGLLVW
ncbi:MAG: phosphatidate cytidylyltransferase [Beijerinckiaceae bacterium]|jgi:phosphatidate cytidylyltransferase